MALLCAAPAVAGQETPAPGSAEVLAEVRVHGNHSTPDADIIALSGLRIGAPLGSDDVAAVQKRLEASHRFTDVEVRKRYRSLEDPSQIVLILLVSEPARDPDEVSRAIGPLHRLQDGLMFMPILNFTDGYGFTYGARATFADVLGDRGRITVPLTWGGVRRAAVEGEKRFARAPIDRLEGQVSLSQRENPHYDLDDRRTELKVRASRGFGPSFRVGGGVGWTDVSFGGPPHGVEPAPAFDLDDRFLTFGADVAFDTRLDPTFPRNAIYLTAAWEALRFEQGSTIQRVRAEGRGYVGLIGQSVLSLRAMYGRANAPLPPYEQWLLGGAQSLRGYATGTYVGDSLVAGFAEVRVPLTSPLDVGKLGVSVFIDSGATAPYGSRLRDQRMHSGAGAGVFLIATVFQLNLDVAKGFDGGTRVHFMTGFSF